MQLVLRTILTDASSSQISFSRDFAIFEFIEKSMQCLRGLAIHEDGTCIQQVSLSMTFDGPPFALTSKFDRVET